MALYRLKTKVVTVTRAQLIDMATAQAVARDYIRKEDADSSAIQASLASVTGVLGLVYSLGSKLTVASGIVSVILTITSGLKQSIMPRFDDGMAYCLQCRKEMIDKGYTKVDVEMPYYELYDNPTGKTYFTFICGEGLIKKGYK